MKQQVEQKCEKVTLRVKVQRKQKETDSSKANSLIVVIYKVEITDMGQKKAYLMLKHNKSRTFKLLENQDYLLDKVKITINKKRGSHY